LLLCEGSKINIFGGWPIDTSSVNVFLRFWGRRQKRVLHFAGNIDDDIESGGLLDGGLKVEIDACLINAYGPIWVCCRLIFPGLRNIKIWFLILFFFHFKWDFGQTRGFGGNGA